LNNVVNLHPLTPHIMAHYAKLYPQNSDRIVTIDSVTSIHFMYSTSKNCNVTAALSYVLALCPAV